MDEKPVRCSTGVFSQIMQIIKGKFKICCEPFMPVSAEEKTKIIGFLRDPMLKSFFSLAEELGFVIDQKNGEHESFHASGLDHSQEECAALQLEVDRLIINQDLVSELLLEGLDSFFPAYRLCCLREGWKVVSDHPKKNKESCYFTDLGHPTNTLFKDICLAMVVKDETYLSFSDLELSSLDFENEECRIGQVNSAHLKAVYLVKEKLKKCREQYLSSIIPAGKSINQVLAETACKLKRIDDQINLVADLFWLGVEEEIPETTKNQDYSLRQDWTVVRVPKGDEDAGQEDYISIAVP